MNAEQAIEYFERNEVIIQDCHCQDCEVRRTILTALREQADREKGCEYCTDGRPILKFDDCADVIYIMKAKNGTGVYYLVVEHDGNMSSMVRVAACPRCGKRLEGKQDG